MSAQVFTGTPELLAAALDRLDDDEAELADINAHIDALYEQEDAAPSSTSEELEAQARDVRRTIEARKNIIVQYARDVRRAEKQGRAA